MPQQPGAGEAGRQRPGGMHAAVVGVHDARPTAPQEARQAKRAGQQKGDVVARTGAIEEPRTGRRLERNAVLPKQVRDLAFEPVQKHERLIAAPI